MNILNVFPLPDGIGGSERSAHLGAQALRAAGHSLFLLHGMQGKAGSGEGYDRVVGIPDIFDRRSIAEPGGVQRSEAKLRAFICTNRIDILHVQGWPRTATRERWAREYAVVATAHVALCPNNARYQWKGRKACDRGIGLGCLTTGFMHKGCGHLGNGKPYGLPGFVRGMADDFLLRRAIGHCAGVIAPSRWLKERLVKDGMSEEIIRVLPPPIAGDAHVSMLTQEQMPPVVTFVGRLVDFKGPDHLLKASSLISSPHRVWFIGDGPMRADLERMAEDLGIGERVTFFGALPPDQIGDYRLRSAVLAVPSLLPETFLMVGPEAMLLRRPIVAYRVGGISEWLHDGLNGSLVEPGDVQGLAKALEPLLHDQDVRHRMGLAGFELAKEWVPQKHASALLQCYHEALDHAKSRQAGCSGRM